MHYTPNILLAKNIYLRTILTTIYTLSYSELCTKANVHEAGDMDFDLLYAKNDELRFALKEIEETQKKYLSHLR